VKQMYQESTNCNK